MGRPPEPERREELLAAIVEYVLKNGLTGLSLRPLARGVGTSARMLLYHFESREKLLVLVIEVIREQLQLFINAEVSGDRRMSAGLRALWRLASRPDARPYIRLFFEVYALAMHEREIYGAFLDTVIHGWIAVLREGLEEGDEAMATLTIAVTRGLMLDLVATQDAERTGRALEAFITEMIEPREARGAWRLSDRQHPGSGVVARLVAEADADAVPVTTPGAERAGAPEPRARSRSHPEATRRAIRLAPSAKSASSPSRLSTAKGSSSKSKK